MSWVPPPGANAMNYHCSCWQRVGNGHSNACNERLVKQLAETQGELAALRRIVKRSLASHQLEKLEDARPYLGEEP